MIPEEERQQYEEWGVAPPTHAPHGTEEDIRANMKRLLPAKWRQEGNMLIGQTDLGEVGVSIPTDLILKGTDEKGLPILEKIVL